LWRVLGCVVGSKSVCDSIGVSDLNRCILHNCSSRFKKKRWPKKKKVVENQRFFFLKYCWN
jgi:hypothetical protein